MKYQRYAELTAELQDLAQRFPALCRLESVGQSPEGREIWSVTLTNAATGDDRSKPAYHINGQHHAGEVTAAAVAVYTVRYLCEQYGTDPAVTELMDTRAVYVLPRLSVDGTEWFFDGALQLRSSPLLYPLSEEPEGLRPSDVNGDGLVLQMRVPDSQGDWKVSEKDPRLMVKRRPEDRTGPFYRLHTEGLIKQLNGKGEYSVSYDERGVKGDPGSAYARERGFDFNRNYPTNWKPQYRQPGAGRYPFDRPEVRAMAEFWLAHPNIGAAMSYHTYSGMNLRPSPLVADEKMDAGDLALYKAIGEVAQRITGYPTVSVYEYFTFDYNPDRLDVGSWLEWCYDEKGVQGFEMELWDWPYVAGVPKRPFKELKNLPPEKAEEERLLVLQWIDKELGGKGFTPWTPFAHPQLGPVEIGGIDPRFVVQNPPEHLLAAECHKNCRFTIEHALALPLLRIGEVRVRQVGSGLYAVAVEVVNRGYLPTNVTQVAVAMKESRGVEVRLSGGARLVAGQAKQHLGEILGRGSGSASVWGGATSPNTSAWAEWVVQANAGDRLTVKVEHDRGGSLTHEVAL